MCIASPMITAQPATWRAASTLDESGHRSQATGMIASWLMLAVVLSGAIGAAACFDEIAMPVVTVDRAERFLGLPTPERAAQVRAAGERGRDELVLLSFEADDRVARDHAARLLGAAPMPGRDPGLFHLGDGVPWWPRQLPPSTESGEARRDDRTIKLLLAPASNQPTRVFVAAFTL